MRIYFGTAMGYPIQELMSGKFKKRGLKCHTSVLHDEINFDWSGIDSRIKMNLYFVNLQYIFLCMEN